MLLHYSTLTAIPICVVYLGVALVLGYPWIHIVAPLAALFAAVSARRLLHLGRAAAGGLVVVGVTWVAQLGMLAREGWTSPTMAVFFVILVLAAALVGAAATLVLTTLTIVAVLGAGFLADAGWLRPMPLTDPTSVAATWVWTLLLTGIVLNAFVRVLLEAMDGVRAGERRWRSLMTSAPDGIAVLDPEGTIQEVNPATTVILDRSEDELLGSSLGDLGFGAPEEREAAEAAFRDALNGVARGPSVHRFQRPDGSLVHVEVNRQRLDEEQGFEGVGVQAVLRDVSARIRADAATRELEAQLRHAQRLESVGRLAGGVAHEFNNCLTVILGSVDELGGAENLSGDQQSELEDVRRAALRAAEITAKLLAFGRRRPRGTSAVGINEIVRSLEPMMGRLVGERIAVELALEAEADVVWADATHIEQVLVNLVVNAADSMVDAGGTLTIASRSRPAEGEQGMVVLAVRDTGAGMDEEVAERVFEPFFSTKAHGEGTGLGLSLVHGIVTQAGGRVEVSSTLGEGTEFRLFFPLTTKRPTAAPPQEEATATCATLRVLVVEDEPLVAKSARRVLQRAGHQVHLAENAAEALTLDEPIDLLLTDVVLPDQSGPELAAALRAERPELVVIFMTGYDAGHLEEHGIAPERLLHKPFDAANLLAKLGEAVEASASPPADPGG